jgi:hypothetical protein
MTGVAEHTFRVRRVRSNGIGLTIGDREAVVPKWMALEIAKQLRAAAQEKCPRCRGANRIAEASTATFETPSTVPPRMVTCPICEGAWV